MKRRYLYTGLVAFLIMLLDYFTNPIGEYMDCRASCFGLSWDGYCIALRYGCKPIEGYIFYGILPFLMIWGYFSIFAYFYDRVFNGYLEKYGEEGAKKRAIIKLTLLASILPIIFISLYVYILFFSWR